MGGCQEISISLPETNSKHPFSKWWLEGDSISGQKAFFYELVVGNVHPWRLTWNIIPWRFGSDHFPFQMGDGCRFQPLIFRGVQKSKNSL